MTEKDREQIALFRYGLIDPNLNIDGKKRKTFLFAFIDDCSRLIPFAQFFFPE